MLVLHEIADEYEDGEEEKTCRERAGPAFAAVKGRVASPADCRQDFGLQVPSLLMGTQWQLCLLRKWKSLYWSTAEYVICVTIFPVLPVHEGDP